jgi:putative peptidoglycan lipid II flippase
LHLGIQLPGLRDLQPRYQFNEGLNNAAVREVLRLMGPRLVGVAAVQINFAVNVALASYLPGGASSLDYAWRIFTMPQVVIAQGIAIAALPTFSAMVARGEMAEVRASLADTLRFILFLALPATVGLFLLRQPIVALFFQYGSFDARSTQLVAWALGFFTLGLVGHSVVEIVSRAFYALHDTRTPVLIGALAMALNIGLSFTLSPLFTRLGFLPHGALALANTAATSLEMVALLWVMRRQLAGLDFGRLWPGLWRALGASAVMGMALMGWLNVRRGVSLGAAAAGGVIGGGLIFWGVAFALGSPEAHTLPRLARARFQEESTKRPEEA